MLVLGAEAGRVRRVVLDDEHTTPAVITVPGMNFQELHTIINGLQSELKPAYQVTDTLGDDVYLLTFGESISNGRISGMIFEDVCDADTTDNGVKGVSQLMQWWSRENMAKRDTPIQITIGQSYVLQAYIAELQVSINNPEDRIWKFQMNLLRVPNREESYNSPFGGVLVGPVQSEDPFTEGRSRPFIELPPELQREPQSPLTDQPAVVIQPAGSTINPVPDLQPVSRENTTYANAGDGPLITLGDESSPLGLFTDRESAGFGESQRIHQSGYATTNTTLTGYLTNR